MKNKTTSNFDSEFIEDSASPVSSTFVNSLDDLTEEDITLSDAAKAKKSLPLSEMIRRIMFVLFAVMFIFSSVSLVQNLIDKKKGKDIYDSLEAEFFSDGFTFDASAAFRPDDGEVPYLSGDDGASEMPTMTDAISGMDASDGSIIETEYNEELEKVRAKLTSLATKNPDLYGWISIEGTNINYPLVQGDDNDYYLDHAYTGDFLPIGSIFVDYRNNTSITKNYNTVIYGHNITSGTMFHDVTKFFKSEYFNDVQIVIYTMDGIYYYEPFAIYETRSNYQYFRTGFSSAEDFIEFAEEMHSNSQMKKDVTFTENDRMLTLSTCTNGASYARYALHAKLVKSVLAKN